jgi:hypothetical protein
MVLGRVSVPLLPGRLELFFSIVVDACTESEGL